MSVINRMLQELEERREDVMHSRLPGLVRAVPAQGVLVMKRLPWRMLIGMTVFILIAVLTWRLSAQWQGSRLFSPPLPIVSTSVPGLPPHASPQLRTDTNIGPIAASESPPPARPLRDRALSADPLLMTSQSNSPRVGAEPVPEALSQRKIASARIAIEMPPQEKASSEKMTAPTLDNMHSVDMASQDKIEIVKSAAGGDVPISSMKQVSIEQRADFRYREALVLITQGRSQEAQNVLAEALRLDPKNLAARQVLLGLLLETKRYAEAEQLVQEALQANLATVTNATALARIQVERGDSSAALTTLEKYLASANDSAAYHGFYAALLQRIGRHTDAIAQFQTALRLQPNQANWWLGLGMSLQNEKRNAEAEQAYLRARAGNSLSPELSAFVEQRLKQVQAAR